MSYAEKGLLGNKDGYRETKGGGYSADVSTFIGRSTLDVVVVLSGAWWCWDQRSGAADRRRT